ncbi:MAG: hypothetical protein ACRCWR_11340, partial [Saezia sp.]
FDFMRLRAEAGEYSLEVAHWWEVFWSGDEPTREELIQQAVAEKKGTPQKKRRKRKSKSKSNLKNKQELETDV